MELLAIYASPNKPPYEDIFGNARYRVTRASDQTRPNPAVQSSAKRGDQLGCGIKPREESGWGGGWGEEVQNNSVCASSPMKLSGISERLTNERISQTSGRRLAAGEVSRALNMRISARADRIIYTCVVPPNGRL